jgi:twitching motility two-component system response regulator PilG
MGRTVLVAEDSQLIRTLILAALKPLECDVVEAEDGEKAIRLAREVKPDLVLLDVVMPRVDGFSVLDILRGEDGCDCAIVMLTTAATEADKEHGASAGADGYIVKPFDKDELRDEVSKHLDG